MKQEKMNKRKHIYRQSVTKYCFRGLALLSAVPKDKLRARWL